jgi:glycine/serine hydroxymethyltransferase
MGFASLLDPESGENLEGDFNSASVDAYKKRVHEHDHKLYATFQKQQIKFTKIYTDNHVAVELRRLFEGR